MKILIVDNKDSFTFNLAHYVKSINNNFDVLRAENINVDNLSSYNKIILSPGPGLPNEHPILKRIIHKYYTSKPILGICLGHQAIAQYFNARIDNLSFVKHAVQSQLKHRNNCYIFNKIPSSFMIGHYHSWVVSRDGFPSCLKITSENDENLITSFTHVEFDINGLQFHPESILTENGFEIIKNWVNHNQV